MYCLVISFVRRPPFARRERCALSRKQKPRILPIRSAPTVLREAYSAAHACASPIWYLKNDRKNAGSGTGGSVGASASSERSSSALASRSSWVNLLGFCLQALWHRNAYEHIHQSMHMSLTSMRASRRRHLIPRTNVGWKTPGLLCRRSQRSAPHLSTSRAWL